MEINYSLVKLFKGYKIWQLAVVSVIFFVIALVIVRAMFINKKTFGIVLSSLILFSILSLLLVLGDFSKEPFKTIRIVILILLFGVWPILLFMFIKQDIFNRYEALMQVELKSSRKFDITSSKTKEIIVDTVFELSSKKTGALITFEKYSSLSQFSERAIPINSDVSKELLLNVFIPNTPLHDGAVIIRNDRIVCAGAYFNLTKNGSYEKTTGSRHRAAIGISEVSDALTVVVSEETGDVSVTYGAVLIPIMDKKSLMNYLDYLDN